MTTSMKERPTTEKAQAPMKKVAYYLGCEDDNPLFAPIFGAEPRAHVYAFNMQPQIGTERAIAATAPLFGDTFVVVFVEKDGGVDSIAKGPTITDAFASIGYETYGLPEGLL